MEVFARKQLEKYSYTKNKAIARPSPSMNRTTVGVILVHEEPARPSEE